jgi:hypothetical protein
MALEKTTSLYELLLRFDGPRCTGAHFKNKQQIIDDGVEVVSKIEPPVSLIVNSEQFHEVIGEAASTLAADIEGMKQKYDAAKAENDKLRAENKALKDKVEALQQ